MAAVAARAALADAGVEWSEIQFAAGGSDAAGNADTSVASLGLTGVPFINVKNGCATGGSALITAHAMLTGGAAELALVVGFDKHPPGAFDPRPEDWGIGSWYGETGLMLTTQFFGMKIQRYMWEHGISDSTLAKVAVKAFHNGALNENAWRRTPLSEEAILGSRMISHPLTQYMFCSPGEGAVALVLARGDRARKLRRDPVYLRGIAFRTREFGTFEVFSPSVPVQSATPPTTVAARAAMEAAGIEPRDVQVAQLQDTESGAEIMHLAETGLCEHGEQEQLIQSGATEIGGRAAGQHGRRLPRQRRADRRIGPQAGTRGRSAAARPGGRPPGPGRTQGRLYPCLWRPGSQRLHRPDAVIAPRVPLPRDALNTGQRPYTELMSVRE